MNPLRHSRAVTTLAHLQSHHRTRLHFNVRGRIVTSTSIASCSSCGMTLCHHPNAARTNSTNPTALTTQ